MLCGMSSYDRLSSFGKTYITYDKGQEVTMGQRASGKIIHAFDVYIKYMLSTFQETLNVEKPRRSIADLCYNRGCMFWLYTKYLFCGRCCSGD